MVDDVADKTSESNSDTGDVDTGALVADADLTIEQQLAIVEDDLVKEDAAKDNEEDTKTAESEESEETVGESTAKDGIPSEFKDAVKEEVTLQMRVSQLEAENATLKETTAEAEEEEEDEDFDYDVGDLDESLEAMRDPLNRMGKFQIAETKKLSQKLDRVITHLEQTNRLHDAQQIKSDLKIESSEENSIVNWAKEKGLSYHDRKSLTSVVELYRTDQELKALKEDKTTRTKATANPRTSTSKSKSSEEEETITSGRSFEDSFANAVRVTNEKIKRGELR